VVWSQVQRPGREAGREAGAQKVDAPEVGVQDGAVKAGMVVSRVPVLCSRDASVEDGAVQER
jgi:hypothetical protein